MLLEQRQFLKGRQSFEILEGEVRIKTHNSGGREEFSVDLSTLSPKTARLAKGSVGPLAGLIAFSVAYAVIAAAIIYGLRPDPLNARLGLCGGIGIVMVPLIVACFVKWKRMKYDVTVFVNRFSGNVVISIANQVPDAAQAEKFITALTQRIEKAAPLEAGGNSLADQLNQLNELRIKGVLSDEEFASAKQRLLASGLEEKRIGFR